MFLIANMACLIASLRESGLIWATTIGLPDQRVSWRSARIKLSSVAMPNQPRGDLVDWPSERGRGYKKGKKGEHMTTLVGKSCTESQPNFAMRLRRQLRGGAWGTVSLKENASQNRQIISARHEEIEEN